MSVSHNTLSGVALMSLGVHHVASAGIAIGPDTPGNQSSTPVLVDTSVFANVIDGTAAGAGQLFAGAISSGVEPQSPGDLDYPTNTVSCSNVRDSNWSQMTSDWPPPNQASSLYRCACISDGAACSTSAACCSG